MIEAVVLAAGESTRLGRPKPLLPLGDETLLERCLSTLRRTRVTGIVVVLGHEADAIRASVPLESATVIVNDRYADGVSASIQAGIRAVPGPAQGALFVPVDQPFLTASLVDRILQAHEDSGRRIVVPTSGGSRGTPVLIDRALFGEADGLLGDVGFRAIFPRHEDDIEEVRVDEPAELLDIDTEEDYAAALRIASR